MANSEDYNGLMRLIIECAYDTALLDSDGHPVCPSVRGGCSGGAGCPEWMAIYQARTNLRTLMDTFEE